MRVTRANVAEYAEKEGLEPIQIDGIIDGFAFKEPDIIIGNVKHKGNFITIVPLSDWHLIVGISAERLLENYNKRNESKN